VVAEKRQRVFKVIREHLAYFPGREEDEELGTCVCYVRGTPFLILYEYDDAELRIQLVIHASSDRGEVDPSAIEW
jgi:hypothetical protein